MYAYARRHKNNINIIMIILACNLMYCLRSRILSESRPYYLLQYQYFLHYNSVAKVSHMYRIVKCIS